MVSWHREALAKWQCLQEGLQMATICIWDRGPVVWRTWWKLVKAFGTEGFGLTHKEGTLKRDLKIQKHGYWLSQGLGKVEDL